MPINRYRKQMAITIAPKTRQLLEQLAKANNRTLSSMIETLILDQSQVQLEVERRLAQQELAGKDLMDPVNVKRLQRAKQQLAEIVEPNKS